MKMTGAQKLVSVQCCIFPSLTHICRWVNEGHDVTTAEELKTVLESHGGVKGCRFAVVEIDKANLNAQVKKIMEISFLNTFSVG